ncbi:DUF6477 family protein [Paracoccus aurantiacus]|uniref:DUF6477 family protein n=1 Tax=Paracoccus aurantiacus TaxID=2599412 RepID=UPI00164CB586|nr:DUF6477 family protein [Paracoccus aurantiacus]
MSFFADQTVFTLPAPPAPLRRPASLIRAAKAGQGAWHRTRDLPRLLGRETMPANPSAIRQLRAAEDAMNDARRESRADYDLHRHVRLIIALLAELRVAAETAPQPVMPGTRKLAGKVVAFSGRGTARPARHA